MGNGQAVTVSRDQETGRQTLMRYLEAVDRGDMEAMTALFADDMVMSWPQSGERFRGRANVLGAVRARTEMPTRAGDPLIVGTGDVWNLMMPLRYGDELVQFVAVFELTGGVIEQATGYFGAAFPADPARAPFAEPS